MAGRKCRSGKAQCRETPDISLDARPKRTGYIIYCNRCGAGPGIAWAPIGGTSAAAPLMAALTADADESAGKQLGLREPVPLRPGRHERLPRHRRRARTTSSAAAATPARPGYDLATGLGLDPGAAAFATALAA